MCEREGGRRQRFLAAWCCCGRRMRTDCESGREMRVAAPPAARGVDFANAVAVRRALISGKVSLLHVGGFGPSTRLTPSAARLSFMP